MEPPGPKQARRFALRTPEEEEEEEAAAAVSAPCLFSRQRSGGSSPGRFRAQRPLPPSRTGPGWRRGIQEAQIRGALQPLGRGLLWPPPWREFSELSAKAGRTAALPVETREPFVPGAGDPPPFPGEKARGLLLFWKISQQRKGKPLATVTRLLQILSCAHVGIGG